MINKRKSQLVGVEHKLRPSIRPNKKDTNGIPRTVSLVRYPSYLNSRIYEVIQRRLGLHLATIILSRVMERQYNVIICGRRWLKCIQVLVLLQLLRELHQSLEDSVDSLNREQWTSSQDLDSLLRCTYSDSLDKHLGLDYEY